MDATTKTSITSFLFLVCLIAGLIKPQTGHGQTNASPFKPFKFELQERFLPVDEKLLQDEVSAIVSIQQKMEKEELWTIRYWNNAYPSYRWHQLLMQASRNHKGHKNGGRVAIMHLAIYDAMVEVWKHKKAHFRKAAYQYDTRVKKLGQVTDYSAFICEWRPIERTVAGKEVYPNQTASGQELPVPGTP
ncbi:MAG: hypothetical protein AAGA66_16500 [Bacteroidota bacterium]